MKKARVELDKDQVNVTLDALEILVQTYQAMEASDGESSERDVTVVIPQMAIAESAIEALLAAGQAAGWGIDDGAPASPQQPLPFDLPEEDEITGYPV